MTKSEGIIYWAPRILPILFICFLTMFSLDVFEPGLSIGEILLGILMHNIPSIIMAVLLAIAWKKEIVGVVSYFGAGIIYIGLVVFNVVNSDLPWYFAITWSLTIAGPAFVIGALFLICWRRRETLQIRTKKKDTDSNSK